MNKTEVKAIIEKEGLVAMARKDPKDVIKLVEAKYPESKVEIIMELIVGAVQGDTDVFQARKELIQDTNTSANVIEAHCKGYNMFGRNPMIHDTSAYNNVSSEESDAMGKEDIATGLRLYNACAEYVRIYNTVKLEMEEK